MVPKSTNNTDADHAVTAANNVDEELISMELTEEVHPVTTPVIVPNASINNEQKEIGCSLNSYTEVIC